WQHSQQLQAIAKTNSTRRKLEYRMSSTSQDVAGILADRKTGATRAAVPIDGCTGQSVCHLSTSSMLTVFRDSTT
ncbi:hypothetical protein Q4595_16590, partial [Wenyingzhuangia sp. 1_MG-2023]|nr:hypothetical protein [Wenyingzhuangia sp. 1_MG-2023]